MFTLEQIDDLHTKLGKMSTFWDYVKALRSIGVEKYESYLTDGHAQYFGADGYQIVSAPVHEKLIIAEESNKESFLEHLSLHEQRKQITSPCLAAWQKVA